jgi:hypothetical protein
VQDFVEFWSRAYQADAAIYNSNIGAAGVLPDEDNIAKLMRWKGGRRFADTAERFGRAVPIGLFHNARSASGPLSDADVEALYDEITKALRLEHLQNSATIVWRLFLCHIAHPEGTPIYDVNVWRGWGFIDGWIKLKHYAQRPTTFKTYLEYRAWHNDIVDANKLDQQAFDQALMAFGQFISSRWGRLLR